MESILSKIFYVQNEAHYCNEKYKNVNKILVENDNYLSNALKNNSELLEHYNALTNAYDEYDAIAVKDLYELGFKSGFTLAMEIFNIKIL